jgi:hypothetical protein
MSCSWFVTVYARNGNHGNRLRAILASRIAEVTVLAQIVPSTRGPIFPTFDSSQRFSSWAFVATAIIIDPTPVLYEGRGKPP